MKYEIYKQFKSKNILVNTIYGHSVSFTEKTNGKIERIIIIKAISSEPGPKPEPENIVFNICFYSSVFLSGCLFMSFIVRK